MEKRIDERKGKKCTTTIPTRTTTTTTTTGTTGFHVVPNGTPNSLILCIVVELLCALAFYIHMVFSFLTFVPCDQRVDQRFMQRKQLKPFISINNQQHLRNASERTIALSASQ